MSADPATVDPANLLIGYTDSPVHAPGDRVAVRVSSPSDYEMELVELLHGDTDPAGPGLLEQPVAGVAKEKVRGRLQPIRPGSYGIAPTLGTVADPARCLTIAVWVYPTLLREERQLLVGVNRDPAEPGALRLALERDGTASLAVIDANGRRQAAMADGAVALRTWALVVATVDPQEGALSLEVRVPEPTLVAPTAGQAGGGAGFAVEGEVLLGGAPGGRGEPVETYDGKLDRPTIFTGCLAFEEVAAVMGRDDWTEDARVIAAWDGARGIATTVWAARPPAMAARLVNVPTRATTGFNWAGEVLAWTDAPEQFAAIHFHSDDLADAGWAADAEVELPADLGDGFFALRLTGEDGQVDRVPIVVRSRRRRSAVAVLVPTLTYLAYGAEPTSPEFEVVATSPGDDYVAAAGMVSQYSHHADGSGVSHASYRRPLPSLRPDYRYWLTGKPHGLGADLYLLRWLREIGQPFDLIADDDLHEDGAAVLAGYRVLVTGSHPEYMTRSQMRALRTWTDDGGRLMYLGGNGFTMVTGIHPELPFVSELRRTFSAAGLWESAPGEAYLAATGEPGGRWAHRRERCREIVGVETVGMGFDGGRPYERCPDSRRPEAAFVFEGVPADALIGDEVLGFEAAAAYEVDGASAVDGTPPATLLLARADGFGPGYVCLSSDPHVRAEMVLVPKPRGGCVFSVGSIAWTAGLSARGGDNPVARITRNVLETFLAEGDLPR